MCAHVHAVLYSELNTANEGCLSNLKKVMLNVKTGAANHIQTHTHFFECADIFTCLCHVV